MMFIEELRHIRSARAKYYSKEELTGTEKKLLMKYCGTDMFSLMLDELQKDLEVFTSISNMTVHKKYQTIHAGAWELSVKRFDSLTRDMKDNES